MARLHRLRHRRATSGGATGRRHRPRQVAGPSEGRLARCFPDKPENRSDSSRPRIRPGDCAGAWCISGMGRQMLLHSSPKRARAEICGLPGDQEVADRRPPGRNAWMQGVDRVRRLDRFGRTYKSGVPGHVVARLATLIIPSPIVFTRPKSSPWTRRLRPTTD